MCSKLLTSRHLIFDEKTTIICLLHKYLLWKWMTFWGLTFYYDFCTQTRKISHYNTCPTVLATRQGAALLSCIFELSVQIFIQTIITVTACSLWSALITESTKSIATKPDRCGAEVRNLELVVVRVSARFLGVKGW